MSPSPSSRAADKESSYILTSDNWQRFELEAGITSASDRPRWLKVVRERGS